MRTEYSAHIYTNFPLHGLAHWADIKVLALGHRGPFLLSYPFLFLCTSLYFLFWWVPCARLSWPCRQLLRARKYAMPILHRIISYPQMVGSSGVLAVPSLLSRPSLLLLAPATV